jgi:hypothetical protein
MPQSIPGVVECVATGHHKNGKWSSSEYSMHIAAGWKFLSLSQDWDMGDWAPGAPMSMREACEAMGFEGLESRAFESFFADFCLREYEAILDRQQRIEALAQSAPDAEVVETTFRKDFKDNRHGWFVPLVDGFTLSDAVERGICTVVSEVKGGGGGRFAYYDITIAHPSTVEVEGLYEGGWDDDDNLGTRSQGADGRWFPA